jgi:uncharacterized protein
VDANAASGAETEQDRSPFWSYGDIVMFLGLAVVGLFLVIVVLRVILQALPSLQGSAQMIALPAQLLLYGILYFALWLIIRLKYDRPVLPSLGWTRSRIPFWQAILGGVVLSFLVGMLGAALRTPQIHSPFDKFLKTPGWIVLFGLFAVVLGPFFEETIFRGFIQPLLARDLGNPAGILLTASIFGLLHGPEYSGSWQYVVLVGFAGACFGAVRVIGRSVVPSAFLHLGFNAVFFAAALFQNQLKK